MRVWLDLAEAPLAVPDDVIPRESLSRLTALDDVRRDQQTRCDQLLDTARSQANAIEAAAHARAAAIERQAHGAVEAATRRGFAEGRAQALEAWHAEAAARRDEALRRHVDQRERLAAMVAQATAALLAQATPAQYFDAALAALDGLAEQSRALLLRVHPDDEAAARASVARRGERWPDGTVVKVVCDPGLQPRDCVCESPRGLVDASLSLQLVALRRAAAAALRADGLPDDLPVNTESAREAPLRDAPVAGMAQTPASIASLLASPPSGPTNDDFDESGFGDSGFDDDADDDEEHP